MKKTISVQKISKIKSLNTQYYEDCDPNEILPISDWIKKYKGIVSNDAIINLFCRLDFLTEKELKALGTWTLSEAWNDVINFGKVYLETAFKTLDYLNDSNPQELTKYHQFLFDALLHNERMTINSYFLIEAAWNLTLSDSNNILSTIHSTINAFNPEHQKILYEKIITKLVTYFE
jgi:DNA-binding response OmpR family regulator